MKTKLSLLFLFVVCSANAQEPDWNKAAKEELKTLCSDFTQQQINLETEKDKLAEITLKLTPDPKEQFEKTLNLKVELDKLYKKRETYIQFYLSHDVPKDSLTSYFPEEKNYEYQGEPSQSNSLQAKTTYYLFGDKQLIKEEDLIKNEQVNKIFSSILSETSESNLGKLEIPATGQKIPVYFDCENCKENTDQNGRSENYLKDLIFEEVNITITEGVFEDVRVTLIDELTKEKY
jgi:hypothetical protein